MDSVNCEIVEASNSSDDLIYPLLEEVLLSSDSRNFNSGSVSPQRRQQSPETLARVHTSLQPQSQAPGDFRARASNSTSWAHPRDRISGTERGRRTCPAVPGPSAHPRDGNIRRTSFTGASFGTVSSEQFVALDNPRPAIVRVKNEYVRVKPSLGSRDLSPTNLPRHVSSRAPTIPDNNGAGRSVSNRASRRHHGNSCGRRAGTSSRSPTPRDSPGEVVVIDQPRSHAPFLHTAFDRHHQSVQHRNRLRNWDHFSSSWESTSPAPVSRSRCTGCAIDTSAREARRTASPESRMDAPSEAARYQTQNILPGPHQSIRGRSLSPQTAAALSRCQHRAPSMSDRNSRDTTRPLLPAPISSSQRAIAVVTSQPGSNVDVAPSRCSRASSFAKLPQQKGAGLPVGALSESFDDSVLACRRGVDSCSSAGSLGLQHRSSIICKHCGRCRCSACSNRRPLPSCWCCGDLVLCSSSCLVDALSCMCCIKACLYHTRQASDCSDAPDEDLCSCASPPGHWALMACASVLLPCLCCFWPLKLCESALGQCYGRIRNTGCNCPRPTACDGGQAAVSKNAGGRWPKHDRQQRDCSSRMRHLPPELPSLAKKRVFSSASNLSSQCLTQGKGFT